MLYRLVQNIIACFWGYAFLFQLVAIVLTYAIVSSGFDWTYYMATRDLTLISFLFPAALIGGLAPVFIPFFVYVWGKVKNNKKWTLVACAIAQAEIVGYILSAVYKALTGRAHPTAHDALITDITREFHFGFLERGVFWGWPSSHTIIAFAMAAAVMTLFPRKKMLTIAAFVYALYIGIGVSITIHWFSDFVAGAIMGIVAGVIVARSFLKESAKL